MTDHALSGDPYTPHPADTTHVPLAPELIPLLESLAANAHDVWARQRIAEGWTLGPTRDDARKTHPGLVPYGQLPESEKEYDRLMASETLRLVLARGYSIVPPPDSPEEVPGAAIPEDVTKARDALASTRSLRLRDLLTIWERRDPHAWDTYPELHALLAKRLLGQGEPLLAHEALQAGLVSAPRDVRLRYLDGLALARGGAAAQAQSIAHALRAELDVDSPLFEDVHGLVGRTFKDLAAVGEDAESRRALLAGAFDAYFEAFSRKPGIYSGINAASIAYLLGDDERVATLTASVRELAMRALELQTARGQDTFWELATLGEAALLLGRDEEAREHYQAASALPWATYGDLGTVRRQARLIVGHRGEPAPWIEQALRIPAVVVFAGHRIDDVRGTRVRFPRNVEALVRAAIDRRLATLDASFGFSQAAGGADIIFQEAMRDRGGETFVVLPYDRAEYLHSSVARASPTQNWEARFERVIEEAADCAIATGQRSVDEGILFEYANQFLLGLGVLRARALGTRIIPLVVWDSDDEPGSPTGTAAAVSTWRRVGYDVEIIDLREIVRDAVREPDTGTDSEPPLEHDVNDEPDAPRDPAASDVNARIAGVMFADVVGFSQLSDRQVEAFVREFLGAVGRVADASAHRPLFRNTWGDGLYFQFESVRDAGLFALELVAMVQATDWAALGLPATLNLRTGLHAGPLFAYRDPVTRQDCLWGRHVTRAARIEPVTPPGSVYASREFAALAAVHGITEFDCEPVGRVSLAKAYGAAPLYHVRRHRQL